MNEEVTVGRMMNKLWNSAWRFGECGEICVIVDGAHYHLHCYWVSGRVVLDQTVGEVDFTCQHGENLMKTENQLSADKAEIAGLQGTVHCCMHQPVQWFVFIKTVRAPIHGTCPITTKNECCPRSHASAQDCQRLNFGSSAGFAIPLFLTCHFSAISHNLI